MKKQILNCISDKSGASVIEYAFLASFIALAIVIGVSAAGNKVSNTFVPISENLK